MGVEFRQALRKLGFNRSKVRTSATGQSEQMNASSLRETSLGPLPPGAANNSLVSTHSLAMPDHKPIRFEPASHEAQILKIPVSRIYAVPHIQCDKTNHWCFYLQSAEGTSVAVNCQASGVVPSTILTGGSKAVLTIGELGSALPPDAVMAFPLDVIPGLTVAGVLHKLTEHGRHRYEFTSMGAGCRYWVANQIDLFAQVGMLVDMKQCEAAKAAAATLWPDRTPLPLVRGAYYQIPLPG
ncbi:uncharacterized protein KD926_010566 [Aspergillus affinis]|uniref:uncharacterized protein n=1 Tax=Aspergillus affinis TaxID=1070780 RepID=UPI0022FE1571|nr:uncharacterized protein KD926_010566 [Aspergillus affinis]KAI9038622.1 hypothetical protein KD926_010566 [Aspergillus affinis]